MNNNIFDIQLPDSSLKFWSDKINLLGQKLPTFTDIVFKEKWHSIYYRYESARNFLVLAYYPGYESLFQFDDISDEEKKYFDFHRQVDFYESSLVFYNMLVDYSWQLAYLSLEYVCYFDKNSIELDDYISKDDSKILLKKLEKNVTNPFDENNPLLFFSKFSNNEKYFDVIDCITCFWKQFSISSIRTNYNKIKHCGNFLYKESYEYNKMPYIYSLHLNGKDLPTDVRDVQELISIKESLDDLAKFDNDVLMPYLCNLLEKIKMIINPTDMVF